MQRDQKMTTGYLLPHAAVLALTLAVVGCDSGSDNDEITQGPSDPASTERAMGDARLDETAGQRDADRMSGDSGMDNRDSAVRSAVAQINPTSAGNAQGTVTFSMGRDDREMPVAVELRGLAPGPHGLHVHEFGDCSAGDASSAGGHFSPEGSAHGSPDADEQHAGDMGNIEAGDDGRVSSELSFPGLAFSGRASILQKSVVIHRNADDMESQPAGDAGGRVGCGVIRSEGQGSMR